MLDIIGVFEKEIDLGSCKNHRLWSGIVDKMIEYALFERKKISRVVAPFGIKITIDIEPKKGKTTCSMS